MYDFPRAGTEQDLWYIQPFRLWLFQGQRDKYFACKYNYSIDLVYNILNSMIYRKPTVINIKAEEDMQDIQPPARQSSQMTPSQPIRTRLQDLR